MLKLIVTRKEEKEAELKRMRTAYDNEIFGYRGQIFMFPHYLNVAEARRVAMRERMRTLEWEIAFWEKELRRYKN
jgi:hypothetical protein